MVALAEMFADTEDRFFILIYVENDAINLDHALVLLLYEIRAKAAVKRHTQIGVGLQ